MSIYKKVLKNFILVHCKLSIILIYNAVTVGLGLVFYYVLPLLMGYPPNTIKITKALGTDYFMQYIIIFSITVIIGSIILSIALKNVEKWQALIHESPRDIAKLQEIRKKCINIPYYIYIYVRQHL